MNKSSTQRKHMTQATQPRNATSQRNLATQPHYDQRGKIEEGKRGRKDTLAYAME